VLDIELEADNRHHAERIIEAQYGTREIKLPTERMATDTERSVG
jgi:hypothetical protein